MADRREYEELLRSLIKIQSPYFHEDEAMDFVCRWLCANGVPAGIHEYFDERITGFHGKNVTGVMDSGLPGPRIFVGGHLDTVNLCSGWTKEPYSAETEDGRMYGVGALDMKSGDAAVMLALKEFAAKHYKDGKPQGFTGKVLYQFASVEEGPFGLGTMFYMIDNVDGVTDGLDLALIAEPSASFSGEGFPALCLGARGGYNYTLKVHGRAAHAATPQLGVNALVEASKIVAELEKMPAAEDEKLGISQPCVIRMDGGGNACSVPDYAEIEIFHHTVRGESEDSIRSRVARAVSQVDTEADVEICFRKTPNDAFSAGFDAYWSDENDPYIRMLEDSIETVCGRRPSIAAMSSIGDFNHFGGKLRVPTVLFGAAGNNYHSADEYCELVTGVQTADSISAFLNSALAN